MKKKRINISDLAKYCGLSPSTVSNAFNETGTICFETRALVFKAAAELNYIPQQTARRDSIAIIVSSRDNILPPCWFGSLVYGNIQHALYQAGYVPVCYNANDISLIRPSLTMAAVALSWDPPVDKYTELVGMRRPVICVNAMLKNTHHICMDHAQGIRLATEYLISKGHRKIGLLTLSRHMVWGERERLRGFAETLNENNIALNPEWAAFRGDENARLDPVSLSKLLDTGITALICPHEDWVLPLNFYLNRMKVRIPEDLSVITCEIPGLNEWFSVPHTALAQNYSAIADSVVQMLHDIRNTNLPSGKYLQTLHPHKLIERESVKSLL